MDEADKAATLEAKERDSMLKAHEQRLADMRSQPSLDFCEDCDGEIPPERQRLGGMTRCSECQGYYQQEQQQKGFREWASPFND